MYILSELLAVIAELYTFHLFLQGIFYRRERKNILWLGVYGSFGFILTALSFIENASYIRLLFCIIAMTFVALVLFESTIIQGIYASISFGCLYVLTDVLTIVAFSLVNVDPQVIMAYGNARAICITVSHTVLLALILIVLFLTKRKRNAITFTFLLAISPGCIIGIILGLFFCQTAQISNTDLPVSFLIAAIGLLYLNILIVFYAEQKQVSMQRQHQLELAEQHYSMQERYYAQLREEQIETRAMFHDINKYMQAMRAMVIGSNSQEAAQVLQEVQTLFDNLSMVVDVGNPVISIIINEYKNIMDEQGIQYSFDISVPSELSISPVDAYVILGNTIDNAIEACISLPHHERYICIQMRTFHDMLYYKIENAFSSDDHNHAKSKNRGYGLQNVRRCVEKHQGEMNISKELKKYTLSIRLNI